MNTMRSVSARPVATSRQMSVPFIHSALAILAVMFGVMLAAVALFMAAIALPLGLLIQAFTGEKETHQRRGWQAVTA